MGLSLGMPLLLSVAFHFRVAIMVRTKQKWDSVIETPFVIRGSKRRPELPSLNEFTRYHLFLSHVWSTGQDQVAEVQQRMQHRLPGVKVFRDVDDLDDVDRLEEYVVASWVFVLFLSEGYFLSRNCLREVRAAVERRVRRMPIMLLRETSSLHGGGSLESLLSNCPDELVPALKLAPDCPHVRVPALQVETLKMIASAIVNCGKELRRTLQPFHLLAADSDLAFAKLDMKKPTWLFASKYNPGVNNVVKMVLDRVSGLQWSPTLKKKMFVRAWTTALDQSLKPNARTASAAVRRLSSGRKERGAMLLYLNSETFQDPEKAEGLAKDLRHAKSLGVRIVTVHEQRPEHKSSDFRRFFYVTPQDLISDGGLYKKLAIPLVADSLYLQASVALIGMECGGKVHRNLKDTKLMESVSANSLKLGVMACRTSCLPQAVTAAAARAAAARSSLLQARGSRKSSGSIKAGGRPSGCRISWGRSSGSNISSTTGSGRGTSGISLAAFLGSRAAGSMAGAQLRVTPSLQGSIVSDVIASDRDPGSSQTVAALTPIEPYHARSDSPDTGCGDQSGMPPSQEQQQSKPRPSLVRAPFAHDGTRCCFDPQTGATPDASDMAQLHPSLGGQSRSLPIYEQRVPRSIETNLDVR